MSKWNPFEKKILKADPDEFSGQDDAGYGVPRDADSITAPESGSGSPDDAGIPGMGDAAADDSGAAHGTDPAGDSFGMPDGENRASDVSGISDRNDSAGENFGMPGEMNPSSDGFGMPDGSDAAAGGSGIPGEMNPASDGFGMPDGSDAAAGDPGKWNQTGSETSDGLRFSADGTDPSGVHSAPEGGGMETGQDAGTADPGGISGADPFAAHSFEEAGEGDPSGTGMPGAGPGFGGGHDFDDEEPKFDTQTGERLDKPKKKLPAILLTFAVSVLAIIGFVYSVKPGALPSRKDVQPDPVETETVLAIAAGESETETEGVVSVQTEQEAVVVPAQTEEETGAQTEEETVTEQAAETTIETETESETEAEPKKAEGGPIFSTDGVTVSASLDVADLVEEVMPEVVSVTATSIQRVRDFFYGEQEILQTDAGSGIIIDRDDQYLYIITDAVIVNNAEDVTVGFCVKKDLSEGLKEEDTVVSAEVMGIDEESLLALIRVPADEINEEVLPQVRTAVLGDSDAIRVGERVFAIGNAMGRGLSVTQGIVSAVERSMRYGYADHDFIQTDASINYGNYGGALLNEAGEVIGINAGKITEESSEGMGFAFPVNDARDAISRLLDKSGSGPEPETDAGEPASEKEKKDPEKQKEPLKLALAGEESETTEDAVQKETRTPEDPAAKESETIKNAAGEETETQTEEKESADSGQTEGTGEKSAQGQLGIQVGEFSKEDQIIYRIPSGVVVADVVNGSGAQAAGLASGDLITGINEENVTSVVELKDALSGLKSGDRVKVSFIRPDGNNTYEKGRETNVTVTLQ